MKKLVLYVAAAGFLFASCQKEDAQQTEVSGAKASSVQSVSPVPPSYIKKVLLEELTNVSVGTAPMADRDLIAPVLANPTRVFMASLHTAGLLGQTHANRLMTSLTPGSPSIPCGIIDRTNFAGNVFQNPSTVSTKVTSMLSRPTSCGVAMNSNVTGRYASIDVHVGFTANMTSSYRMHAYLIEDVVSNPNPLYSQANAYNNTAGNPFYALGNPITNYVHKNVVRKVISPASVESIVPAALVAGGSQVFSYQIDLLEKSNTSSKYKVLAFITDNLTGEVLNVQCGELGRLVDWN